MSTAAIGSPVRYTASLAEYLLACGSPWESSLGLALLERAVGVPCSLCGARLKANGPMNRWNTPDLEGGGRGLNLKEKRANARFRGDLGLGEKQR